MSKVSAASNASATAAKRTRLLELSRGPYLSHRALEAVVNDIKKMAFQMRYPARHNGELGRLAPGVLRRMVHS